MASDSGQVFAKIKAKRSPEYKYLAWKAIEDIRKAPKPKHQLDFKRQKLSSCSIQAKEESLRNLWGRNVLKRVHIKHNL